MGLNIGSVPEALERVQALFRLFPYPERAPSSVVPTDAVRTECRSDPIPVTGGGKQPVLWRGAVRLRDAAPLLLG